MRGPIDFIIVGFEGNKFNGSILSALTDELEKGTIGLIDLSVISKNENGEVTAVNIVDAGDDYEIDIAKYMPTQSGQIGQDDVDEVADLLENNTAAGLLVIEHLWAKPLKQAIVDAGGFLISDGRIHPDAAFELNK